MLTVNIDNDAIEARLRERAAANGHSPDNEAREVLGTALLSPPEAQAPKTEASARSLVDEIQDLFAPFGGLDLHIPPRRRSARI